MKTEKAYEKESFLNQLDSLLCEKAMDVNFSIEVLCRSIFMSRSNLHRRVTASSGMSIAIYIREFRLKKAFQFLHERDCTVSEIAYSVGFSDLSYFSKSFKDKFGLPPSEVN